MNATRSIKELEASSNNRALDAFDDAEEYGYTPHPENQTSEYDAYREGFFAGYHSANNYHIGNRKDEAFTHFFYGCLIIGVAVGVTIFGASKLIGAIF